SASPTRRAVAVPRCVTMLKISNQSCSVSMSKGIDTCIGNAVCMGLVQGQIDHVSMTYPPVCTENLIRVDDVMESPSWRNDRASVFRPDRLGRANQIEGEA